MIPQVARSIAHESIRVMRGDDQTRRRVLAGIAATVAALAVVATGCTSNDEPPPSSPLGSTPAAASPTPDATPPATRPSPTSAPSADGAPSPEVLEALVGNALQVMAGWLGWDVTHFSVEESEAVVWSDGCLGVEVPGTLCTQALVPGFRAVLRDGHGGLHTAHGDAEGRVVRWVGERVVTGTIVDGTQHWIEIATDEGAVRVNAAPGSRYWGRGLTPTAADLRPIAEAVGDAQVAVAVDPSADGQEALVIAWLVVLE